MFDIQVSSSSSSISPINTSFSNNNQRRTSFNKHLRSNDLESNDFPAHNSIRNQTDTFQIGLNDNLDSRQSYLNQNNEINNYRNNSSQNQQINNSNNSLSCLSSDYVPPNVQLASILPQYRSTTNSNFYFILEKT